MNVPYVLTTKGEERSGVHPSTQPGDNTELPAQLLRKLPEIAVDDNGGSFPLSTVR